MRRKLRLVSCSFPSEPAPRGSAFPVCGSAGQGATRPALTRSPGAGLFCSQTQVSPDFWVWPFPILHLTDSAVQSQCGYGQEKSCLERRYVQWKGEGTAAHTAQPLSLSTLPLTLSTALQCVPLPASHALPGFQPSNLLQSNTVAACP